MKGEGQVRVVAETAAIRAGDAVPILPGHAHGFTNTGTLDLELMIIGVATDKGRLETEIVRN